MLRGGSRTFYAASVLLPRRVRAPAIALYAFCRQADDAIDLGGARLDALSRLRERLDRAYAGRPLPLPADRAFADVVKRFAMPRALPEALLEGLEWDAAGRRYKTRNELYDYAARVAGTVGAMMCVLMGARRADLLARACDLGVAMQLTNIARDVGEDAREGRLYLPLQWLTDAGIDPEAWIVRPVFSDRLASVVQRLLAAADVLYERACAGIAALPADCRPGIYAARWLYAEIGREVERDGLNSVSRRAVVPLSRKAAALSAVLRSLAFPPPPSDAPPLEETRFLVDTCVQPSLAVVTAVLPARRLRERVLWLIDLFERLERADQLARGGSQPG
ncbi:MAG TPA: phytoene/squalene synthase family protein [Magnetospirillaceae bacterium]|nr:phytoene/squalene synthase family protein [Magnetospirillaceae bacterium]